MTLRRKPLRTSTGSLTERQKSWLREKIRLLIREGYVPKQAIAIGLAMGRKKGFHIPELR